MLITMTRSRCSQCFECYNVIHSHVGQVFKRVLNVKKKINELTHFRYYPLSTNNFFLGFCNILLLSVCADISNRRC